MDGQEGGGRGLPRPSSLSCSAIALLRCFALGLGHRPSVTQLLRFACSAASFLASGLGRWSSGDQSWASRAARSSLFASSELRDSQLRFASKAPHNIYLGSVGGGGGSRVEIYRRYAPQLYFPSESLLSDRA